MGDGLKEVISLLVQFVLIPAIPIVGAYAVKFFKIKANEAATSLRHATASKLLYEAAEAVSAAVGYTAQTYVDSMKVQGKFDEAAQKTALDTALEKAKTMLTQQTQDSLKELYGDVDEWLKIKIEHKVQEQKKSA